MRLRFLEDITQKLAQQRLLLILLSAAAGIATLFTGLLLRPVLLRGLSPLDELGQRMQTISTDSLDSQRVLVAAQPTELAPIALAFNDLLDRLSASWERQRGFANGVSHELRTPISLIRNYASSLRRRSNDLSDQQAEQLALIETEANRMGKLVADLLALTRIEAHRTLMPYEPFDVAQAIERVAERLRSRCYGRLRVCPGATQSARTFALGDADRFEQCLANLIENAQKYDPGAGPIQLRLDASLDRVVVHVIDSGPGVPDNEKALIFERFGRGRHSSAVPGSGVGLAVVRALMEAMGGSVSVADGPEGGLISSCASRAQLPFSEHEAHPAHRLDQGGQALGLQLAAQITDVDAQQILVAEVVLAPHLAQDVFSRHHPPRAPQQAQQQVVLTHGQGNRLAGPRHLPGGRVDRDIGAAEQIGIGHPAPVGGAPQLGADAGQQFFDGEGFEDVIVGPRIERFDTVADVVVAGEHQHGGDVTAGTQPPADLHTTEIRQRPIQQHQIGVGIPQVQQSALAVFGFADVVALAVQFAGQEGAHARVVLDDQQPRGAQRGGPSFSMKPTPRTVWIRVGWPAGSSLRRK